jgi:hypothetical protein
VVSEFGQKVEVAVVNKSLYAREILTTSIYNIGLACFLVNSDVDLRLVTQFQCPIFQTLVTCVF